MSTACTSTHATHNKMRLLLQSGFQITIVIFLRIATSPQPSHLWHQRLPCKLGYRSPWSHDYLWSSWMQKTTCLLILAFAFQTKAAVFLCHCHAFWKPYDALVSGLWSCLANLHEGSRKRLAVSSWLRVGAWSMWKWSVHNFFGLFWGAVLVLFLQSSEARFGGVFCLCCFLAGPAWLLAYHLPICVWYSEQLPLSTYDKKTRVHFMYHPVPCCNESEKTWKWSIICKKIEKRTSNKKSNKHILILVSCNDEHCRHVSTHRTGSCLLFAKFETLSEPHPLQPVKTQWQNKDRPVCVCVCVCACVFLLHNHNRFNVCRSVSRPSKTPFGFSVSVEEVFSVRSKCFHPLVTIHRREKASKSMLVSPSKESVNIQLTSGSHSQKPVIPFSSTPDTCGLYGLQE